MYTVRYLIIKYAAIKQKKYVIKHTSFEFEIIKLNISLILDTISLLTSLKQCIKLVE